MATAKGVSLAFMAALYISVIQGAGAAGATFEIQNGCRFTVWAAGSPGGGKRLERGQSWTLEISNTSTGGRFWGRTGCSFNGSGSGSGRCNTGDCGGLLNCQGNGSPPMTMFEYTLGEDTAVDFYDISLVDGFNLPLSIIPSKSSCVAIACSSNITAICPTELRVSEGCQSACTTLNECGSSNYSKIFKGQCPQAYSYATDDATSTFTCPGSTDYKVVFCGGNASSLQAPSRNLTAPPENSPIPPTSTNLTSLSGNLTQPSGKTSSKIVPIVVGSVVGTALIVMLCLVTLGRRRIRRWKTYVRTDNNLAAREDFGEFFFDYKVLRDSTGNFDRNNMLGKGGFGEVYKAWNQFEQNQVLDIVDSSLEGQYPGEQALRVIKIALLCTQGSWSLRPAMSTVVSMLTNNSESIPQPTRPAFIEAAADRPESAASAAAPTQGSHGSISVSLFPR